MNDVLSLLSIISIYIIILGVLSYPVRHIWKKVKPFFGFGAGHFEKTLERVADNPILAPLPAHDWEQGGTFNPAAYRDEFGVTHMLYRAVGGDGVSRLGYGRSTDGEHFERLPYPVYVMEGLRTIDAHGFKERMRYDPVMYPSGGSYGGAEDPRMVLIGDRIYVSCSAFDGWDFVRIAVFSIAKEDFIKQKWNWSKPLLISPQGVINKNWMLFPEKINGKFAILHSLTPGVQVAYVNALEDLARGRDKIESRYDRDYEHPGWDTWMRGPATPPMRTKYGWLVLYHATDKREPHKYKLGALILDAQDPARVLARSPEPILSPDEWYENEGKPGVVYACGAVINKDTLSVYYGGGDRYACVAHTSLSGLLEWLMNEGRVQG